MPWYLIDVIETRQRCISYRIFRETEEEAEGDALAADGFDDEDEEIEVVEEDHDFPTRTEVIDCKVESPPNDLLPDAFRICF